MLAEDWARAKPVLLRAIELPSADRLRLIQSEFPNQPRLWIELVAMLDNYRTATLDREPAWATAGGGTTRTALSAGLTPVAAENKSAAAHHRQGLRSLSDPAASRHWRHGSGVSSRKMPAWAVAGDAVKSLAGKWLASPVARLRLMREARSTPHYTHPNIATVYDGISCSSWIRGGPIPARRDRRRPRSALALRLIIQIADAIGYAHDRGIVHCDLKPANVQLTPEGTAKVLDFGLARAAFAPEDEVSSSEGRFGG